MKLPLTTAAQSSLSEGATRAPSPSALDGSIIPTTIYDTQGKTITGGDAFTVISGACGTVGAAFAAGRNIYLVPGTYGSTGWHKSSDMYPTASGFLKVETTKANGTECTCHVYDAQTPKSCYAASCSCTGKQGYTWQLS